MLSSDTFFRLQHKHKVDLFFYSTGFLSFFISYGLSAAQPLLCDLPQQCIGVARILNLLAWYSFGSFTLMLFTRKLRFSPGGSHTATDK